MSPFGILLLVAGLVLAGLGVAGLLRANRLAGPRSRNVIYEARRRYENPEHGRYVDQVEKAATRLIVMGVSLGLLGLLLILR
jgi:hypothetical protein